MTHLSLPLSFSPNSEYQGNATPPSTGESGFWFGQEAAEILSLLRAAGFPAADEVIGRECVQ
jgi:hypothetical protein